MLRLLNVSLLRYVQNAAAKGDEKYPKFPKTFQYGTAGFREKAEELPHILYRMGLLAALRSAVKKAAIGVMVTASHNPVQDNGVKLCDPQGEMLEPAWEKIGTELANTDDVASYLKKIIEDFGLDSSNEKPFVFVGQDTRPSSDFLAKAAIEGAENLGALVRDIGIVSTPILHFVVASRNASGELGLPTEGGYFNRISSAFVQLKEKEGLGRENRNYKPEFDFDGANGVGADKMAQFAKMLTEWIDVTHFNTGEGQLNFNCGADFVKVQQAKPEGVPLTVNRRGVSVDGDADRIIYFYTDSDNKFHLLDGDKIATLVAGHLMELVSASGLDIHLGLVQTAYANGSSTEYISQTLKVPVACVPTGVKHLHHKAQEFDVGVYFEANGHGTVIFSKKATNLVRAALENPELTQAQREAAKKLSLFGELINQTVGDALSDLLLVETILHSKGWSVADWDNAYTDLPSRQLKVTVKDRNVVSTTDAERKCVTPAGLQDRIDAIVANFPKGRSFVRPSGTEDVVRVYAEAESRELADELAKEVARAVHDLANGTGPAP
ncbi:phosphoacetylglucosamine mutase isoform X1 [Cloeon dipterum]|uniref:phosphoacetylglucosamine mutase isoform X1 n=2 Tax=Cloeon dipterum TaxID=197152 RepID=UPI0032206897